MSDKNHFFENYKKLRKPVPKPSRPIDKPKKEARKKWKLDKRKFIRGEE